MPVREGGASRERGHAPPHLPRARSLFLPFTSFSLRPSPLCVCLSLFRSCTAVLRFSRRLVPDRQRYDRAAAEVHLARAATRQRREQVSLTRESRWSRAAFLRDRHDDDDDNEDSLAVLSLSSESRSPLSVVSSLLFLSAVALTPRRSFLSLVLTLSRFSLRAARSLVGG